MPSSTIVKRLGHLALCAAAWMSLEAAGQCTPGWLPGEGVPGVAPGTINAAVAWDPDGTGPLPEVLVVGGVFTLAGTTPANHVATWDGAHWQALGAGMNNDVRALAVYNNELIAGGNFTQADGQPMSFIARWDGSGWQPLGSGVASSVNALLVFAGDLIVGGGFGTAGGVPGTSRIARWDGTSWHALSTGMSPGSVSALAVFNGELIAGGGFTTAGGAAIPRIARWDGAAWQGLGTGIFGGEVRALRVFNGELVAGGLFNTAGGVSVNRIARWNGSLWQTLGAGMNESVLALLVHGSELIVGGSFTTAGGHAASRIASWNGTTWQSLGSGMDGAVAALCGYQGALIAGGGFGVSGGRIANRLARWTGAAWQPIGAGMNQAVRAFSSYNGELIAGGAFTAAGGAAASRIARWDGATWQSLGAGMNNETLALTVHGGELIASGTFTLAGGAAAERIARWNGTSWQPLGTGLNSAVRALGGFEGALFAGGNFSTAGGVAAAYIARWDGASWQAVGGGMNNVVHAFATYNGELIAGGYFTTAGGGPANRIARWNGTSWQPLGSGCNNEVLSLCLYNGELIAGGGFSTAGGVSANRVARWNGSAWQPLGTGMSSGGVNALQVYSGELYAAGTFTIAGGASANRIARWNGTAWQSLEAGMNDSINALHVFNGELIAGGAFTTVAGGGAGYWARRGCPADTWLCPGDIALIGWSDNGTPDTFAFVALRDLPAGTEIYFTDNGWSSATQAFRNTTGSGSGNEQLCKWTAESLVPAGTIISAYLDAPEYTWTTSGSIPGATGSFGVLQLSTTGDQIYAFQAFSMNPLANPTVHLFVLDDTNGFEDATSASTGAAPPGLRPLLNALTFNQSGGGQNFMAFNPASLGGVSALNLARLRQQIANGAHWTFGGSGTFPSGSLLTGPLGPTVTHHDTDDAGATVDGVLSANEYGPGNSFAYTGGGGGFGGTVGAGVLYFNSDGENLYLGFQPGADVNDNAVIYLDTTDCVSGHWDQTLTDLGDGGRAATSDLTRDRLDYFRILPDFALVFSGDGAGAALYDLAGPGAALQFIDSAGVVVSGTPAGSGFREAVIPLASLGLTAGAALDFHVAYCSDTRFNSNESIPPMPDLNSGPNPGFGSAAVEYTGYNRFVIAGGCSGPAILSQPEAVTACAGGSAVFTVSAEGAGLLSFLWRRAGQPLTDGDGIRGAATDQLVLDPVNPGDAGDYDCVVSSACGAQTSAPAALVVRPAPLAPLAAGSLPASVCPAAGGSITLTATGGAGDSLTWHVGGCDGKAIGTGTPLVLAAPSVPTTYYARWGNDCGSSECASVTVDLAPTAILRVAVELSPLMAAGALTRCITFELWDSTGCTAPVVFEQELTFAGGLTDSVDLVIPCGPYDCLTARDGRHTLRRSALLTTGDGLYQAEFMGPAASGGWLVGGNLDASPYIDIIDFAIYLSLYLRSYGTGDIACAAEGWHADINGDGVVNTLDFGFIFANFLAGDDPACCHAENLLAENAAPARPGPETRLSVAELERRGLGHAKPADLNSDGWIDLQDVVEFLGGHRP